MNNKFGLALIAALIALKFVVVPWLDWISLQSEALTQKTTTLVKLQQLDAKRAVTEQQIAAAQALLNDYHKKMLVDDEAEITTKVFNYLKDKASQHDAKLSGLRMGERQDRDVIYFPVQFNLEGNSTVISGLLDSLNDAPFKLVISQARLVSREAQEMITLGITIYVVAKAKESGTHG